MDALQSRGAAERYDVLAPDGSEIRLLVTGEQGSMVHCRLPPGGVSMAVRHRTVEEVWYVLSGQGELWRKRDAAERVEPLPPGLGVDIPLGTHFQFRTVGSEPLCVLIVTMPPWPGADEAVRVPDHWPVG
ncbi:MAG TPA: cupin domain-containing protein [bacterium]|nr:cupin domain-containing protein [bacterium]